MGFDGKQVIHPCQIDATRHAFVPSDDELCQAERVVAALIEAERDGRGAVQIDGKLVDYANIRMARRAIAMAANETCNGFDAVEIGPPFENRAGLHAIGSLFPKAYGK